jgi:hypothetical protein
MCPVWWWRANRRAGRYRGPTDDGARPPFRAYGPDASKSGPARPRPTING